MKLIPLFPLLLLLTSLPATAQITSPDDIKAEAKAKAPHISADDVKAAQETEKKALLVDVRTEKEFLAGHLQGAVWIPRGKLEFDIQKITTDPDQPIVLYCRTGGRASLAAMALKDIGYRDVKDLDGGFKAWVESGNPVYSVHGEVQVVSYGKEE